MSVTDGLPAIADMKYSDLLGEITALDSVLAGIPTVFENRKQSDPVKLRRAALIEGLYSMLNQAAADTRQRA